ncbi:MAG TPA: hypothetical protein VM841_10945, partial [Actinomycetota bacterium]|nr:hypothetical protein [Actinomycetota bacterium]
MSAGNATTTTNGELRMVRSALLVVSAATPPTAAIAWLLRGPEGAISVLLAVAIVLANAFVSAAVLAFAVKRSPLMGPSLQMPSYAFRMAGIVFVLAKLRNASFVDVPTFAICFAVAVVATLAVEARVYKRTPWVALTF